MKQSHAELAMVWGNMIARCYDENASRYPDYGAGEFVSASDGMISGSLPKTWIQGQKERPWRG